MKPGDLVRILPHHSDHTGGYSVGAVVSGSAPRISSRLLKIPPDAPPAVFLAHVLDPDFPFVGRLAQVLLEGQIVNVSTHDVEPVK